MALKDLQQIFPLRTALRVHEFCDAFGIGITLFYSLVKTGEIRVRKVGRVTIIPMSEVVVFSETPNCVSATALGKKKAR
jgi:hypothetical protein